MHAVTVLTVNIVTDGHLGFKAPQLFHHKALQHGPGGIVFFFVDQIGLLHIIMDKIRKPAKHRVGPNAYRPKTVEHFMGAQVGLAPVVGHINHLDIEPLLAGI